MTEGKLKRAAVVLYAKQEKMKFMQCMIKMARFKGITNTGDFIDNQQIYGNTFRLLEEADAFLRRHLPIASFFKSGQFKRIDKPALPVMAIREALINALCHRDYTDKTTDISLAIYDDRLEIWNSGTLLKNLTITELKRKHLSILRNKLIADVFYMRGMIEKWGSGINKMVELCIENGLPEPSFEKYCGNIGVIFKFKEPIGPSIKEKIVNLPLTERQKLILTILRKHHTIGIKKIIMELKDPPTERTVRKDLEALKENGLADRKGAARNTIWMSK